MSDISRSTSPSASTSDKLAAKKAASVPAAPAASDDPGHTAAPAASTASSAAAATPPAIPTGRAMWAMMALMLGSNLLASFNQSLMNIALDATATQFHISLSQANWLVLGFTIVAATVITMAASLLKRFGIRKVMMFGYAASLAGSVLGMLAWNFPTMLAARLIQALTVGLFFPVVTSVILTLAPKGKSATMLAINSGAIGVGLAFSPLLSGLVLTYVGLRALFAIPLVMSAILLGLGFFFLHDIYAREDRPIDILSVVLSFAGLSAFIFGLNEVTRTVLPSVLCMAAGAVGLGLFAWRQFAIPHPLLNLAPLRHGRFVFGEVLMMLGYMGSIYLSLLVPLYLEGTAGYTAFAAGGLLCAPILCYAGACFLGGRIEDRHGVWPLVPLGFLVLLVGYIAVEVTSAAMLIVPMILCAGAAYVGVGLVFPTLKAVDLDSLPRAIYAHGSSIHSTLVQIAGSVGSALFVGIMSADTDRLMAQGIAKAHAYASGFSHTIFIAIGILAVAFVGAVAFGRLMRRQRQKGIKSQSKPATTAPKA
ncbi:MFS transporter [uncultured Adlercreutzia sp.]|uniref:MFS transporter n=1 Tax=uncultured Adlercreutzia sp. TaxID=875803 RepID=UPI0026758EA9|nr:MFS transporter [uncultured Adlercreutzia sp.]